MSATVTVRLPRKCVEDHFEVWEDTWGDELPCPEKLGRYTHNEWVGPVTRAQLEEIISRADYYADPTGFIDECMPLCRSAARTLAKARGYLQQFDCKTA